MNRIRSREIGTIIITFIVLNFGLPESYEFSSGELRPESYCLTFSDRNDPDGETYAIYGVPRNRHSGIFDIENIEEVTAPNRREWKDEGGHGGEHQQRGEW